MTTSGAGTAGTDLLSTRVKLEGVGNYVTQGRGATLLESEAGSRQVGLSFRRLGGVEESER